MTNNYRPETLRELSQVIWLVSSKAKNPVFAVQYAPQNCAALKL